MRAYILGAGASVAAGYPVATELLHRLSDWLDHCQSDEPWVGNCRNRIVQIKETFGSLDDFEDILRRLEEYGYERVKPRGATTYKQNPTDIIHDCNRRIMGEPCGVPVAPARGFYPQYLRSELIQAFREFFYQIEQKPSARSAYDCFAEKKCDTSALVVTLNYDVVLERALLKAGRWDVGDGYGFQFLPDRPASPVTVYKLHGSVNWFKHPVSDGPPPVIFERDLKLLGYCNLVDPRIGPGGMAVDNQGTFILPDPHKVFLWERFWRPLWQAAADGLRAADEVFIHGYSLPGSDSQARRLLFDNIKKSAAVNIYCLKNSHLIAEEFRNLQFENVRPFPSVRFETWAVSD